MKYVYIGILSVSQSDNSCVWVLIYAKNEKTK